MMARTFQMRLGRGTTVLIAATVRIDRENPWQAAAVRLYNRHRKHSQAVVMGAYKEIKPGSYVAKFGYRRGTTWVPVDSAVLVVVTPVV